MHSVPSTMYECLVAILYFMHLRCAFWVTWLNIQNILLATNPQAYAAITAQTMDLLKLVFTLSQCYKKYRLNVCATTEHCVLPSGIFFLLFFLSSSTFCIAQNLLFLSDFFLLLASLKLTLVHEKHKLTLSIRCNTGQWLTKLFPMFCWTKIIQIAKQKHNQSKKRNFQKKNNKNNKLITWT